MAEKLGDDAEDEMEDVSGKSTGAIKRSKKPNKEERVRESSQISRVATDWPQGREGYHAHWYTRANAVRA
jgi:hypothetical protein